MRFARYLARNLFCGKRIRLAFGSFVVHVAWLSIPLSSGAAELPASFQVQTFQDCDVCPVMVVVPAGSFTMGSVVDEAGRYDDEGPPRVIKISAPFAVGKYEVTFDEWDACTADGGCDHQPDDRGWGRGRRPVINVGWHDTRNYLAWLNSKTGKPYRLASEAEWEYAARAGTTTSRYWGDDPSLACRYANVHDLTIATGNPFHWRHHDCQDGFANTAPVGSFLPNAFGLHDMLGNVWEWVEDCTTPNYLIASSSGKPVTTGECFLRMLRGGAWFYPERQVRAAKRRRTDWMHRSVIIGFRVVRDIAE